LAVFVHESEGTAAVLITAIAAASEKLYGAFVVFWQNIIPVHQAEVGAPQRVAAITASQRELSGAREVLLDALSTPVHHAQVRAGSGIEAIARKLMGIGSFHISALLIKTDSLLVALSADTFSRRIRPLRILQHGATHI
jgi:hypothetical protein